MNRILTIALTILLTSTIWSSAHAVGRYSYNPSQWAPIKVLAQWAIGNQRISVQTVETWVAVGPCWQKTFAVYSVWYNHFTYETTVQMDRSVVTETVCP